jgi:hypothetical protein
VSHQLTYEPNGLGVVVTFSGFVNGEEIHALNKQLVADPTFSQWHYQIWDFSNIEGFSITTGQLRSFAGHDAEAVLKNPHQRIAVIPRVASYNAIDRIFRIYEEIWTTYESRTFPSLYAARAWASSAAE